MSKRTWLSYGSALLALLASTQAFSRPPLPRPPIGATVLVSGQVMKFEPDLRVAVVGTTLVYLDNVAESIVGPIEVGDELLVLGAPVGAPDFVRAIAVDVVASNQHSPAIQAGEIAAGTSKESITGTGIAIQSITGTGKHSITGTGFAPQSITGTGKQSITGTGAALQSITGTGKQSITGTGPTLQSITGTGKRSGVRTESITGTGLL